MEQNKNHTLNLEYKQGLIAGGIADVIMSNDKEVVLALSGGGKVKITGENLKILGFDKVSCNFRLGGNVFSIRYSSGSQSAFKNLFK